ncbi:MAG TPA: hypothetical protein VFZ97_20070 [Acidimicrobiales bacterium]
MRHTRISSAVGGVEAASVEETAAIAEGLTPQEDDELRRLHWFSQIGSLGPRKAERMIELRLRDRRAVIRPPRDFVEEEFEVSGNSRRRWYHFRTR